MRLAPSVRREIAPPRARTLPRPCVGPAGEAMRARENNIGMVLAPAANGCLGTGGCVSGREGPVNCELWYRSTGVGKMMKKIIETRSWPR